PAAEILEEEARRGANAAGTFLEEFAVQGARDDHGQRCRHSSDQAALPGGVPRCGVRAEKAWVRHGRHPLAHEDTAGSAQRDQQDSPRRSHEVNIVPRTASQCPTSAMLCLRMHTVRALPFLNGPTTARRTQSGHDEHPRRNKMDAPVLMWPVRRLGWGPGTVTWCRGVSNVGQDEAVAAAFPEAVGRR